MSYQAPEGLSDDDEYRHALKKGDNAKVLFG